MSLVTSRCRKRLSQAALGMTALLACLCWTVAGAVTPQIAVGGNHTVVLETDGSVWTWGYNNYGQIGDGTTNERLTAVKVLSNAISVAAGEYHTLAVKAEIGRAHV